MPIKSTISAQNLLDGIPPKWKSAPEEPYYIRHFSSSLARDADTFYVMEQHPNMQSLADGDGDGEIDLTYEEIFELGSVRDGNRTDNSLFAVTDDESNCIGWVWYYRSTANLFPRDATKKIGFDRASTLMYQISYQKLMSGGWPENILDDIESINKEFISIERKGVAVSGVRQTLPVLRKKENETAKLLEEVPKRIVVFAYIDPDNLASESVLFKNSFQLLPGSYNCDGVPNHCWYKEI